MCNEHQIFWTCGHVEVVERPCSVVRHTTINYEIVTQVSSHCGKCIVHPDFPTRDQRDLIQIPTLDRLMTALKLWDRLHFLFAEEFSIEDEEGRVRTNIDDHPTSQTAMSEEDLDQLKEWLTILQESRRRPETWENALGYRAEDWDKLLMLQIPRIIVNNEIALKDVNPLGLPFYLTKMEIADLADDERRDCLLCWVDFGKSEHPDVRPELPRRLPCGHFFGAACINKTFTNGEGGWAIWMCPLCRDIGDPEQFVLGCPPEPIPRPWWMSWLKRSFEEDP